MRRTGGSMLWFLAVLGAIGAVGAATVPSAAAAPRAAPSVSVRDASVVGGNTGNAAIKVLVRLSEPTTEDVTVHFATIDGDAVAGADYTARTGKVTIDAGKVSASIKLSALGDTLDEDDEGFTVRLSRVTGATLGDRTGAVTIGDDDPLPSVELLNCGTIEDPSGLTDEGDTGTHTVPFVVRLSVVSGRGVSVHLVTTDFTATSPGDYVAVSTTVTIPAGATSGAGDVTINGDTATENDELFFATIDTPANATISNDNSYCDIVNDD